MVGIRMESCDDWEWMLVKVVEAEESMLWIFKV